MLEKATIQNYQSNKKVAIEFGQITTIVGVGDEGKSGIMRALNWVCHNKPLGDAFINYDAKGTTVKVWADGHTVVRKRGRDGTNLYFLDGKELKNFVKGVPEPIENLLNMGDINWQGQHDKPYWLGDTPGVVSKQLNAIVDLGIMDDTTAVVAARHRKDKLRVEIAKADLEKATLDTEALDWVPEYIDAVANLVQLEDNKLNLAQDVAILEVLVDKATKAKLTQSRYSKAAGDAETWHNQGIKLAFAQSKVSNLENLVKGIEKHTVFAEDADALHSAIMKLYVIHKKVANLTHNADNIETKENEICELAKALKLALSLIPETCPTCGQSL